MAHRPYLRFFLLLAIALILLLPPPSGSGSAQVNDDCQDCTSTCTNERQTCLENGNPPAACTAAFKACLRYCLDNFCQTP